MAINPVDVAVTLFKVFTARRTANVNVGNIKQWYQSKALVSAAVGVAIWLGLLFGVDLKGQEAELTVILMGVFGLVSNILTMYGRVKGEAKINDSR
jgi:hypothetical protein